MRKTPVLLSLLLAAGAATASDRGTAATAHNDPRGVPPMTERDFVDA